MLFPSHDFPRMEKKAANAYGVEGWAHTHGIYDGPTSNEFSKADIFTTSKVGTGYLGTPTGRFKVLQPGQDFGTDLGSLPPCRCYVNP